MTVYRTCYGCVLRGRPCDRRDAVAKVIKGFGVQSLKFKCADRKPLFAIGAPVWVKTVYDMNGDGGYDGDIPVDYYPGHVIDEVGTKVLVYIRPGSLGRDDADSDCAFVGRSNGFCKVSLSNLSAREGEVEPLCNSCQLPESMGHLQNYMCEPVFSAEIRRLADA